MIENTTLFVIIVSLFVVLRTGRWWLSKKIVQGRVEKHRQVPWLWVQERALLLLWGALIVRSLAPWLFVSVLRPLRAIPVGIFAEDDALCLAGLALLIAAIVLQLRAKWELGANWSNAVKGPIVREGKVTVRGLYRWSRNPMYCGSLAEAFALVLLLQNVAALLLGVLTYCYVRSNIAREETLLREMKGPEYARYYESVPRFFWKW
ncbi:MAG: isoprenylcysteine carboxylmethyltransferase family protein [bacterium]|nr:isoprenylcysteine carboxylmethyltransferase family protein [bacterium]MDZ4284577.1 isoprenylcysteine carboxylmethyltransferase family protein [Patescibacteria group bacterium]